MTFWIKISCLNIFYFYFFLSELQYKRSKPSEINLAKAVVVSVDEANSMLKLRQFLLFQRSVTWNCLSMQLPEKALH